MEIALTVLSTWGDVGIALPWRASVGWVSVVIWVVFAVAWDYSTSIGKPKPDYDLTRALKNAPCRV